MLKKLKIKFKVKNEILALTILIIINKHISTIYYNYTKKKLTIIIKKLLKIFILKKQ